MPSFSAKSRPVIVFVVFPDAKLLDITGPMQVFSDAKICGGEDYEIVLASANGGIQLTDAGVELSTEPMERLRDRKVQTLLISGGWGARTAAQDPVLVKNTILLANQAERVGSVCTGAFVLAASGLLDGHRAVTHWYSCDDLAGLHPEVKVEPLLIDAMCAHLVRRPEDFDVIVTGNMYGDILSDLAGELSGSLGLSGAIMAGDDLCAAQAQHGSAPDIAGQDRANPTSLILSAAMLLDWLAGRHDRPDLARAAEAIRGATDKALSDPATRTADLGGALGTAAYGEVVAEWLG